MEASPSPGLEAAAPQLSPIEAQAVLSSDTSFALSDPVLGLSLSQQQEQQQAQPTTTLEVVDPAALQGEFLVPFTGAPAGELATAASSSSNSAGRRGRVAAEAADLRPEVGIKVNGNTRRRSSTHQTLIAECASARRLRIVPCRPSCAPQFRHKQRQALRQGDPQVAGARPVGGARRSLRAAAGGAEGEELLAADGGGELCTIDYFVDDAYLLGDIEFGSPSWARATRPSAAVPVGVLADGKAMRLRLQPGESWTASPTPPASPRALFISSKITRGIKKRRRELEQGPGGSQASAGSQSQSQDLDDPDYEGDENLSWIASPGAPTGPQPGQRGGPRGALPAPPSQEQSGELAASGTQGDDRAGIGDAAAAVAGPSSQASVVERSQSSRGGRGGGGAGAHAGRTALARWRGRRARPAHPYFLSLEFSHFTVRNGLCLPVRPKEPGWYCIRGSLFAALDGSPSIASSTLWLPSSQRLPENRRAKEILRAYEIDQHAAACLAMQLGRGGAGLGQGRLVGRLAALARSSSASSGPAASAPRGPAPQGRLERERPLRPAPIVSAAAFRRKSAKLAEAEAMEEGDGDDGAPAAAQAGRG
eukprot:tig00001501_g9223.t1